LTREFGWIPMPSSQPRTISKELARSAPPKRLASLAAARGAGARSAGFRRSAPYRQIAICSSKVFQLVLVPGMHPAAGSRAGVRPRCEQLRFARSRAEQSWPERPGSVPKFACELHSRARGRPAPRCLNLTHSVGHESLRVALSEGLARMANRSTIQGSYPCVQ